MEEPWKPIDHEHCRPISWEELSPEMQAALIYLQNNEWGWVDESAQQDGSLIRLLPNEQDSAASPQAAVVEGEV